MLIFPDSNVETEYTDPNGVDWIFDGTGWVKQCDCPDGGDGGGNGANPDPIEPDSKYSNTRCVINGEFGSVGDLPIDATGKSILLPRGEAANIADGKYGNGGVSVLKATKSYIGVQHPAGFWGQPWTLEGWFQFKSQASTNANAYSFFSMWDASSINGELAKIFMLRVQNDKKFQLLASYTGSTDNINKTFSTGSPAFWDDPDRWYHVAASHQMNAQLLNVYLDGVRLISQPITSKLHSIQDNKLYVSARDSKGGNQGDFHIDDFRLTHGYCRYSTDTFTPPKQVQYQQTYSSAIEALKSVAINVEQEDSNDVDLP